MRHTRAWSAIGLIVTMMGCHVGRPDVAVPFLVSSELSDYLPAGRFRGGLWLEGRTLHVRADTLLVLVPGPYSSASPPVVRDLDLSVLLAVPDTTLRGWHAVSTAAEHVPIPGILRLGEQRAVAPQSFTLTMPDRTPVDSVWVVFAFTGQATQIGTAGTGWQTVETFACAPFPTRHASAAGASEFRC